MDGDGSVAGIPSSSETPAAGSEVAAVSALLDALNNLAAERPPCSSFAELAEPAPAEAAAPNPSQAERLEAMRARLLKQLGQADVGHACRGDAGSSNWPPPGFGQVTPATPPDDPRPIRLAAKAEAAGPPKAEAKAEAADLSERRWYESQERADLAERGWYESHNRVSEETDDAPTGSSRGSSGLPTRVSRGLSPRPKHKKRGGQLSRVRGYNEKKAREAYNRRQGL